MQYISLSNWDELGRGSRRSGYGSVCSESFWKSMDSPTAYETVHRTVSYPSVRTGDGLSNPSALQNKKAHPMGGLSYLVGG